MDQDKIEKLLADSKLDALVVTNPVNIFYLTGFTGVSQTEREALLILKKPKSILITAKLYQAEARKVASTFLEVKIAAERNEYEQHIKNSLQKINYLGFEGANITYLEHKKFRKYFSGKKFIATKNLVEKLREIKSQDEIAKIEKAQKISQKAFYKIIKTLKVGQTEAEIADKLVSIMKTIGSHGLAFDPIVASGRNSALPHYKTGDRRLAKNDILLFDFGAKIQNYCADLSRTIFVGTVTDEQKNIYNYVKGAQEKAISAVKSKQKAKSVFTKADNYFKKLGLDSHFIHSLGHGIGLEIHESPSLSRKSKDILENNMVFSIEPGLYFPWGGVRIEDLFTISRGKPRFLGSPSQFIEILLG